MIARTPLRPSGGRGRGPWRIGDAPSDRRTHACAERGVSGGLSPVTGSGWRNPLRGARFGANPSALKASWGGAGSRMAGNLVQGAVFTVMVVRAGMLRDPAFELELAEQVRRSPRFFLNAPVVLDLKDAAEFTRAAEFAEAREILRRQTLSFFVVKNPPP